MTNSEYTRKHSDPFLKNYDKEMKQIQQHLISLPCYRDIVSCVPDPKKSNRSGSAMNHILCDYEAKLLEDMIEALIDNGFTPSVRMFDGCMIEGTVDNPEELLDKIEKYVNSKYEDLNIQIITKPHDQTIQLPERIMKYPPQLWSLLQPSILPLKIFAQNLRKLTPRLLLEVFSFTRLTMTSYL